jgi:hypothetical protein
MQNANLEPTLSAGQDHYPVVLVPRIDLHIYCDNQQTGQILQAAVADKHNLHPASWSLNRTADTNS